MDKTNFVPDNLNDVRRPETVEKTNQDPLGVKPKSSITTMVILILDCT